MTKGTLMEYNPTNNYFLVDGWFEDSSGLNGGKFYGAYSTQENLFEPKRCVLGGEDARRASEIATQSKGKVFPFEISECGDGLNKKEREDTEDLLLDKEEEKEDDKEETVKEMTGAGAIGARMNAFMDKSKLGMPDRGGHGRIDGLTPSKQPRKGANKKKSTKGSNFLKGFGTKQSMNTVSQGHGSKGGMKEDVSSRFTGHEFRDLVGDELAGHNDFSNPSFYNDEQAEAPQVPEAPLAQPEPVPTPEPTDYNNQLIIFYNSGDGNTEELNHKLMKIIEILQGGGELEQPTEPEANIADFIKWKMPWDPFNRA